MFPNIEGWLSDQTQTARWVKKHGHVHLSGHVHEADSEDARSGAGGAFLRVVAGAGHSDPKEPAAHGYNVASIVVNENGRLAVRVRPRMWSDKNRDFRADVHNLPRGENWAEHRLDSRFRGASFAPPGSPGGADGIGVAGEAIGLAVLARHLDLEITGLLEAGAAGDLALCVEALGWVGALGLRDRDDPHYGSLPSDPKHRIRGTKRLRPQDVALFLPDSPHAEIHYLVEDLHRATWSLAKPRPIERSRLLVRLEDWESYRAKLEVIPTAFDRPTTAEMNTDRTPSRPSLRGSSLETPPGPGAAPRPARWLLVRRTDHPGWGACEACGAAVLQTLRLPPPDEVLEACELHGLPTWEQLGFWGQYGPESRIVCGGCFQRAGRARWSSDGERGDTFARTLAERSRVLADLAAVPQVQEYLLPRLSADYPAAP